MLSHASHSRLLGMACPRSGCEIQSPKSACTYKSLQANITDKKGNNNFTYKYYMVLKYQPISSCHDQLPRTSLSGTHPSVGLGQLELTPRSGFDTVQNSAFALVGGPHILEHPGGPLSRPFDSPRFVSDVPHCCFIFLHMGWELEITRACRNISQ
jgi:hypothetical protein